MRKSTFAGLIAVAALLIAMVPVASAAPLSTTEGTPNDNDGSPTGYYIFHHDETFFLKTHGPGAEHAFDAVLHTGGTFDNVTPVKLEPDDRINVTDGGHTLVLHFHTYDGIDGVTFVVHNGDRLRLNLKLDGSAAPTNEIFLGPEGRNPKHNPFTLVL